MGSVNSHTHKKDTHLRWINIDRTIGNLQTEIFAHFLSVFTVNLYCRLGSPWATHDSESAERRRGADCHSQTRSFRSDPVCHTEQTCANLAERNKTQTEQPHSCALLFTESSVWLTGKWSNINDSMTENSRQSITLIHFNQQQQQQQEDRTRSSDSNSMLPSSYIYIYIYIYLSLIHIS